jgi:hypothetical protein
MFMKSFSNQVVALKNRLDRGDGSTRPRALWIPLIASCLVATSCAVVGRLGYENLPTLAMWRVDSYLSLNADQRELASRRLGSLHAWHRDTQLDGYIAFLRGVQRHAAARPIEEADIRRWRAELLARWRPIAEQAAPAVAAVAVSLEPDQIARMKTEIERDNAKVRKERMPEDPAERVEVRARRYVERAELFMGSLTASQKQLARRLAAEAPATEDVWYAQRLGRQQDFVAVMDRIRRERPPESVAAGWMRDHLMRYGELRDGPERAGAESSLASSDAMTATMLAQATPKQREHLQRKLQEWIDLLASLKSAQTARAFSESAAAFR